MTLTEITEPESQGSSLLIRELGALSPSLFEITAEIAQAEKLSFSEYISGHLVLSKVILVSNEPEFTNNRQKSMVRLHSITS
jgi:hypothetical protein